VAVYGQPTGPGWHRRGVDVDLYVLENVIRQSPDEIFPLWCRRGRDSGFLNGTRQMNPNGPVLNGLKITLSEKVTQAGIAIYVEFAPGDLGLLIHLHGIQNFEDYGFNFVHEAYCAKIAAEFLLNPHKDRSAAWIAKKDTEVVGSILIIERSQNEAQLRLLFVAKSVRGIGLGRWLVEEAIRYSVSSGFGRIYLWTVEGLDRAISIYESVGFVRTQEKLIEAWGQSTKEIRFDLPL
jgi:GNAT superfamily N-acetyltransferase